MAGASFELEHATLASWANTQLQIRRFSSTFRIVSERPFFISPADDRHVNRNNKMPNEASFGTRIAATWRVLVEHMNTVTGAISQSPEYPYNTQQPRQQSGEKEHS